MIAFAPARVAVLLGALLLPPLSAAEAHTVSGRVLDGKAAIAEFRFSDGSPMAFADVKVFAPSRELWLAGRADGAGRFAFMPDKAGEWTLEAREAENHTARLTVAVDPAELMPTALIARHWAFVLLGSLALNIWLASMLLKYRRAAR